MNEIELQALWVRLQTEMAELNEARAAALACQDREKNSVALARLCDVHAALRSLKDAKDIRSLLAKVEALGSFRP